MERAREHTRERPEAVENGNIKTGKGVPRGKKKRGSSLEEPSRGGGWHGSFQIPGGRGQTGDARAHIEVRITHRRSELASEKGNSSKPAAGAGAEYEEQVNLLPPGG